MILKMDVDASSPFSAAFDYCSGKIGERFQNPIYPVTEFFNGSSFRESLATVRSFGYRNLLDMLVQTLKDEKLVQDAALNFLSAGE